jgi:hypothetical protein
MARMEIKDAMEILDDWCLHGDNRLLQVAWGRIREESPVLGEESPAQNTMEICHTAPNNRSHAICESYGIYRRKNCRAYIGNKYCGDFGNCIHKRQAVR